MYTHMYILTYKHNVKREREREREREMCGDTWGGEKDNVPMAPRSFHLLSRTTNIPCMEQRGTFSWFFLASFFFKGKCN